MSQKLRIALFGAGKMGTNHARTILESPDFELVAVVDPEAGVVLGHSGEVLREMPDVARYNLDAAIVATPTRTHFDVAARLVHARVPVLVEKPLAGNYYECLALDDAAKKRDSKLAVGHVERFNPAIWALHEVLRDGAIGDALHANVTRVGGYPSHVTPGNNVALDLAVHDLDILQMMFGRMVVLASACHTNGPGGVVDTAEVLVSSLAGNATASIHVNWVTPVKIRTYRVTGTKGVCFVDLIQQTCRVEGDGKSEDVPVVAREPLAEQLEAFDEYCRTGNRGLLCSAMEAASVVHLAERALHSMTSYTR